MPRKNWGDSATKHKKERRDIGRQRASVYPSVLPSSPKFYTYTFLSINTTLPLPPKKTTQNLILFLQAAQSQDFWVIFCLLHHVMLPKYKI